MPQTEPAQRGVPLVTEHTRPHDPQLVTLVVRSTQDEPHRVSAQTVAQAPRTHDWLVGQRLPQRPQWVVSLRPRVSQPLALLPSQSR